jgi:hypothetical protein
MGESFSRRAHPDAKNASAAHVAMMAAQRGVTRT